MRLALTACLALAIYLASSRSELAAPNLCAIPYLDKYLHFLIFGLLATNLIRIPLCSHKHLNSTLAFALTSLYGFADEYRQSFTLGRSVELGDALADSLGALVATQIYARWTAYQNLLEWPLLSLKKLFLKSRAKQRQR